MTKLRVLPYIVPFCIGSPARETKLEENPRGKPNKQTNGRKYVEAEVRKDVTHKQSRREGEGGIKAQGPGISKLCPSPQGRAPARYIRRPGDLLLFREWLLLRTHSK